MERVVKNVNRREFLKTGFRTFLASGFILGSLFLVKRSEKKNCQISIPCQNCRQIGGCRDPKALSFKKNENYHPKQLENKNAK